MNIVITGAGGFIGKNLLLGLSPRHRILALDRVETLKNFVQSRSLAQVEVQVCELTDEGDLKQVASKWGEEQEAVIYLAGNGDPTYSVTHPQDDLRDTVLGLINFCKYFKVGRMIYFSSGAVYDGLSGPVSPASRVDPRLPYAISKLACEQYVKFFQKMEEVKSYIILRFFGAYGPYEPPRKIYSRLISAFYLEKKKEFVIRGDGQNLIDAMFVDDTVRGVKEVLESEVENKVVDFCVGEPLTLRGLVEEASRIFGVKDVKIVPRGKVPEYIAFRPSPSEMKHLFGFTPTIPLSQGLPVLARYLEEHQDG